jgi:hypothetical protein
MIVIRYREDPTAAILTGSAIVLMVGALAFMFLAPRPSAEDAVRRQKDKIFQARLAAQTAEQKTALAASYVGTHAWAGSADEVSPAALTRVTSLAKSRGLNLLSFRPQRAAESAVVTQLPFLATVEGTYPSVMAFTRDLETEASRLVVTSVMISSTDASSDRVTASIGLLAFINPTVKVTPSTTPNNGGKKPSLPAPQEKKTNA